MQFRGMFLNNLKEEEKDENAGFGSSGSELFVVVFNPDGFDTI